jgi:hypothetical protein
LKGVDEPPAKKGRAEEEKVVNGGEGGRGAVAMDEMAARSAESDAGTEKRSPTPAPMT